MAYRNKVFVSFDGDADIHYYRLMCAWKQNDRTPFNFYDAHDLTRSARCQHRGFYQAKPGRAPGERQGVRALDWREDAVSVQVCKVGD